MAARSAGVRKGGGDDAAKRCKVEEWNLGPSGEAHEGKGLTSLFSVRTLGGGKRKEWAFAGWTGGCQGVMLSGSTKVANTISLTQECPGRATPDEWMRQRFSVRLFLESGTMRYHPELEGLVVPRPALPAVMRGHLSLFRCKGGCASGSGCDEQIEIVA
jgi:hypothetical protein